MDLLSTASIIAAVVAVLVGFLVGRSSGRPKGGASRGGSSGFTASGVSSSADEAFYLALSRIGGYLRENVDAPLAAAFKDRRLSLRKAAEQAVAAVDDLHFFLQAPSDEVGEEDLLHIAKESVRDFEADWDLSVMVSAKGSVPVHVNSEALLDALYLILHNSAVFGEGKGVVVTVSKDDEWGRVLVQDDGPGFTAEALARAYDPFYTTSEDGLGLGLSHARRAVELQAGRIHLRNRTDGGAEVEIAVPLA